MIDPNPRRSWPDLKRAFGLGAIALVTAAPGATAGDGVVALQTGDPSCRSTTTPPPIYVDCGNGTVTDNRTGLIWLKNANCLGVKVDWFTAMDFAAGLSDLPGNDPDDCGLSDSSSAGEWRLPTKAEWEAMIADALTLGCDFNGSGGPSITDDSGATCWQEGPGNSFQNVANYLYWSSTTKVGNPANAADVDLSGAIVPGGISGVTKSTADDYVWPVRGGQ